MGVEWLIVAIGAAVIVAAVTPGPDAMGAEETAAVVAVVTRASSSS